MLIINIYQTSGNFHDVEKTLQFVAENVSLLHSR